MIESHVYYREFLSVRLSEKALRAIRVIVGLLLTPARALRCEMAPQGASADSEPSPGEFILAGSLWNRLFSRFYFVVVKQST